MRNRWYQTRGLVAQYGELLLAASVAIVVAILGIVKKVEAETLSTVTLGVLAVLAAAIVRERLERNRTMETAREMAKDIELGNAAALEEMRELAQATHSDEPWRVLDESITWDLVTRHRVNITDKRTIRFLHAQCAAVWEWFRSPEGAEMIEYGCEGGLIARPMREWPVLAEPFLGRDSQWYRLVSTAQIFKRGDRAHWITRRTHRNQFPHPRTEGVSKTIEMPTDDIRLKVVWPKEYPPVSVLFERGRQHVDLETQEDETGRRFVLVEIPTPVVRERLAIQWDWEG